MNVAVLGAVIGVVSALFGMLISYVTFTRGRDKDIKLDAQEQAKVSVQLSHISKGVDDIKLDLKTNERQIKDLSERLIKIDESTKSAHKRIDKLEGVKRNG